ncbi:max-binding protein MNT isoform X3 [Cryptotermes secundus]|uniref:max-binding protein MNT isoform X3 n=1 Tax=Cryptotermes secundus TaxID=105785 RepID=UPI000CD7D9BA|nr:max-binding protein MNT isoform X3 [Cryptotermes secundus]
MAYRGIRGSDPFASKTTRNERFAQMSKQEQLIEQKKREIQEKLEDQKKKETEEALKKLQGVSGNCRSGPGNRSNSNSGQHKVNRKPFWKSNQDQRWKRDSSQSEDTNSSKVPGSVNIFSNDGSFLDQFKKLSGVKEVKSKKGDDVSVTNSNVSTDTKCSASAPATSAYHKHASDTDWGTWGPPTEKQAEKEEAHGEGAELHTSQDQQGNEDRNQDQDQDTDHKNEDLRNSERLGTSHWFQQKHISSGSWQQQGRNDTGAAWRGQDSPSPPSCCSSTTAPNRSSSPYSPSSATVENKEAVPPINITSTSKGPVQYSVPSIRPSPIMPLLNPPQHQFITYSSPPPPLHSIPPPSPMQPHTIPTPPPLASTLSIHPASTPVIPAIPQPPPTMQHPLPSLQPSSQSLPPHLMQHPPPLLQHHAVPLPGVLQTQALGPTPLPTLMAPLLQHPLPPLRLPPAASAPACPQPAAVPSICTSSGTGVSPAAMGVVQARGPNGGQSSDAPADPAADEARNHLARTVAQCGDDIEQIILVRNPDDPSLWFLSDKECPAYLQYRQLVEKFRMEMKSTSICEDASNSEVKDEPTACVKQEQDEYAPLSFQPESSSVITASTKREHPDDMTPVKQENARSSRKDQEDDNSHHSEVSGKQSGDESDEGEANVRPRRKRRSRWAPETEKMPVLLGTAMAETGAATTIPQEIVQPVPAVISGAAPAGTAQLLSKVTRTDPALIQYAAQAFGTVNLSEEDWKKAEDHYKLFSPAQQNVIAAIIYIVAYLSHAGVEPQKSVNTAITQWRASCIFHSSN